MNDALARMNVNSDNNMQEGDKTKNKKISKNSTKKSTSKSKTKNSAPLAAPEDDSDDLAEYAQVKDVYGLDGVVGSTGPDPTIFNFTHHDGTSSTSKSNSKTRHRRDKGPSTH